MVGWWGRREKWPHLLRTQNRSCSISADCGKCSASALNAACVQLLCCLVSRLVPLPAVRHPAGRLHALPARGWVDLAPQSVVEQYWSVIYTPATLVGAQPADRSRTTWLHAPW